MVNSEILVPVKTSYTCREFQSYPTEVVQIALVLSNSEHIAPASRKAVLAEVKRLYIQ